MKQWLRASCIDDVRKFYEEKYAKNGLEQFKGTRSEAYWNFIMEVGLLDIHGYKTRVLDAGCGHGEFLEYVSKKVDADLYGVEFSMTAVNLAIKRLSSKIRIFNIAIEEIEPESWLKFDCVNCLGVLEHSMNPLENFFTLYDLLAKDGLLLIVVPLESENCLDSIKNEKNTATNERFMTAKEWKNFFPLTASRTKIIDNDIAMIYKK